ncbi:MAG: beta strand repeat-containing protein [Sporichthyaceae bacterium]
MRRGLVILFTLLTIALYALPASAYWTTTGAGVAVGTTGTLAAPTGVTVPAHTLSTVAVSWTASSGSPAPDGYYVTRSSGGAPVAACASSATMLLTAGSCTDLAVPDGAYTYTVTAVFRSWTAASAPSGSVNVWTPTKVAFTGQPTTTVAGTSISPAVAVTVQTAAGVAVPLSGTDVTVAIAANPGGGTLSGTATATTDAAGVATFTGLQLNKAGVGYTLSATSSGLTSDTSATFTISPATADRFVITSAPVTGTASASAALGPITVQRQDHLGNPAAPASAVTVDLSSSSAGASFSATSGGAATTSVTIPALASSATFFYGDTTSGSPTITASGALAAGTQGATITAGTATKFAITSAAISNGAASISATLGPLTVTRQDALGNPATGGVLTVTLTSSSAGPTYLSGTMNATTTSTVTIASGQTSATFYYGDTKPGTPTITASGALTSATQSQSIVAGPAAKLVITSGSIDGQASAVAVRGPIAVQVRDIAENPVTPGAVVSLSSDSAGISIFAATSGGAGVSTITVAPGQSSAVFYYGDRKATGAGSVTVTAAASGLTSATLAGAITPAAASQLQFGQQPTNTGDGGAITPDVTARILDQFGNLTASTASVSIAIENNPPALLGLGGGILSGTSTRTAVAGVATFSGLSIDGALGIGGTGNGYTLKVTSPGLTQAISAPFNIT